MSIEQRVASVRQFNRFYTRTIGVLGDGVQRTPYTLTEARLLFELAHSDGQTVETLDLRQRLGLDPGYLSRIFTKFESDGLVRLERSAVDGRRQVVSLTDNGRRIFTTLDSHAKEDMRALLDRLDEPGQQRLLDAMATIERLWDEPPRGEVAVRAPRPGELGWVVQRHGAIYAEEYGWNDEFEAMIATIVGEYVKTRQPGRDAAWVAELDGVPAGCVFCVSKDDSTAKLRLLLVESWARGKGVGAKLVDTCIEFARSAGYREMVLWTNAELHAARRLYERAGFVLVSQEDSQAFGSKQTFQDWRLAL